MLITQRNCTSAILIQFFIEIIIFIAIYYYFIYLKYQKQKVLFYRTLLYVYIIGILFVTLLPLDFQYAQFDHFHHFTVHNFTFPFGMSFIIMVVPLQMLFSIHLCLYLLDSLSLCLFNIHL